LFTNWKMSVQLHSMKGSAELQRLRGLPGISFLDELDPNKFLHLAFDSICGNQANFSSYESVEGFSVILDSYKFFLKKAVGLALTKDQIVEDLTKIKVDAKYQEIIVETVLARNEDVRAALVEYSSAISQAHLEDFDWKVQLTLSSDKISTLRQPVLLLNLTLNDNNLSKKNNVLVELPKSDLDDLIKKLELVSESVQELRL